MTGGSGEVEDSTGALWKMEGAGNDFLVGAGHWAERLAEDEALVADLCRRHRGIGADGVLALFPESGRRLRLVYRNADGSRAAFCANGTRCAALAAVRFLGFPPDLLLATDRMEVRARVSGGEGRVRLDLPKPTVLRAKLTLETADGVHSGTLIDAGVPHFVVPVENPDEVAVCAVAPALRSHREFGPGGANVTFVGRTKDGRTAVRTFERGVEGETLCCGSGVLAAGWLEWQASDGSEVCLLARSGDVLTVADGASGAVLEGPARLIARCEPETTQRP